MISVAGRLLLGCVALVLLPFALGVALTDLCVSGAPVRIRRRRAR